MHEEMALAHALGQRRDLEDSNSKIRLDKSCSEERRSNPRHTTSIIRIRAGGDRLPMCIASQAKPRTSPLSYFHQLTNSISD